MVLTREIDAASNMELRASHNKQHTQRQTREMHPRRGRYKLYFHQRRYQQTKRDTSDYRELYIDTHRTFININKQAPHQITGCCCYKKKGIVSTFIDTITNIDEQERYTQREKATSIAPPAWRPLHLSPAQPRFRRRSPSVVSCEGPKAPALRCLGIFTSESKKSAAKYGLGLPVQDGTCAFFSPTHREIPLRPDTLWSHGHCHACSLSLVCDPN